MENTTPTTSYPKLKSELKSGDIIMFQGFDFAGYMIMGLETLENIEPFTHVGIVMEMPAFGASPAGLYFWQAQPPDADNQFGPDYFKQVASDGCVMVSLDAVMAWVSQQDTSGAMRFNLIARQLNNPLAAPDLAAMLTTMRFLCGRSFSTPTDLGMVADYYKGCDAVKKGGQSSANDTFFCSKLASQTFQGAGILPATLVTNSVLPGHFGSNQDNTKLQFLKGYGFGADIYFTPA